jgi:uncharacterized membrane protein
MAAFLASTISFLAILRYSLTPRWKAGEKKAFWVGAVFLTAGYALLCVVSFEIRPPSPLILFEFIASLFTGVEIHMEG